MKMAKAAVFTSIGEPMELLGLPIPELKTGEILIKVEYTTLCRSDLNTYCGKRTEPTPTILGHESVGRVVAFGPQASKTDLRDEPIETGDRLSWAIFASDPDSALAEQGIPQKGTGLFKYGHERLNGESVLHGGLGEYIILRRHTPVLKVNESVPVKIAAIINCAVATVAGAIRLAGAIEGKDILVSGAGMLGMIACAMLKTNGAASVTALDINEQRLVRAGVYGADKTLLIDDDLESRVFSNFQNSRPFHVVIELSGVAKTMERTLELLSVGSTAVWVGATYPERNICFSAESVVRNLLTIRGLHNYNREDFLTAVEFIEDNHDDFPFGEMVYDQFNLNEVNEAFEYGLRMNPFRVGIKISD